MCSWTVEGIKFPMTVDTGAEVSLIAEETRKKVLPDVPLQDTNIVLRTYTEQKMPVLGEIVVEVHHKGQRKQLPLVVVKGYGETLVGRNWLTTLKLDWKKIFQLKSAKCNHCYKFTKRYSRKKKGQLSLIMPLYKYVKLNQNFAKQDQFPSQSKKQWVQNWTNLKPVE